MQYVINISEQSKAYIETHRSALASAIRPELAEVVDAIARASKPEDSIKEAYIDGYQAGWNDFSTDPYRDEERFREWNK